MVIPVEAARAGTKPSPIPITTRGENRGEPRAIVVVVPVLHVVRRRSVVVKHLHREGDK